MNRDNHRPDLTVDNGPAFEVARKATEFSLKATQKLIEQADDKVAACRAQAPALSYLRNQLCHLYDLERKGVMADALALRHPTERDFDHLRQWHAAQTQKPARSPSAADLTKIIQRQKSFIERLDSDPVSTKQKLQNELAVFEEKAGLYPRRPKPVATPVWHPPGYDNSL